jgi:hypothetical protein
MPAPPNEPRPPEEVKKPAGMNSYAKAGAYMGLATITPISGYICYLIGGWLDAKMGWNWAATTGLMVGCVAGMYETFRQAVRIEGLDKRK